MLRLLTLLRKELAQPAKQLIPVLIGHILSNTSRLIRDGSSLIRFSTFSNQLSNILGDRLAAMPLLKRHASPDPNADTPDFHFRRAR